MLKSPRRGAPHPSWFARSRSGPNHRSKLAKHTPPRAKNRAGGCPDDPKTTPNDPDKSTGAAQQGEDTPPGTAETSASVQASSGWDRRDEGVENQPRRALKPRPRGPQRRAGAGPDAFGATTAASRRPTFSGWMPTGPADAPGRAVMPFPFHPQRNGQGRTSTKVAGQHQP